MTEMLEPVISLPPGATPPLDVRPLSHKALMEIRSKLPPRIGAAIHGAIKLWDRGSQELEAIVDGSECDDQSAESVVDIAEIAQTEIGNIVFEIRTSLNDQGKEALMRTKEKLATLGSLLNCMRNNKDALSRPSEGDDEDEEILERGIRRLYKLLSILWRYRLCLQWFSTPNGHFTYPLPNLRSRHVEEFLSRGSDEQWNRVLLELWEDPREGSKEEGVFGDLLLSVLPEEARLFASPAIPTRSSSQLGRSTAVATDQEMSTSSSAVIVYVTSDRSSVSNSARQRKRRRSPGIPEMQMNEQEQVERRPHTTESALASKEDKEKERKTEIICAKWHLDDLSQAFNEEVHPIPTSRSFLRSLAKLAIATGIEGKEVALETIETMRQDRVARCPLGTLELQNQDIVAALKLLMPSPLRVPARTPSTIAQATSTSSWPSTSTSNVTTPALTLSHTSSTSAAPEISTPATSKADRLTTADAMEIDYGTTWECGAWPQGSTSEVDWKEVSDLPETETNFMALKPGYADDDAPSISPGSLADQCVDLAKIQSRPIDEQEEEMEVHLDSAEMQPKVSSNAPSNYIDALKKEDPSEVKREDGNINLKPAGDVYHGNKRIRLNAEATNLASSRDILPSETKSCKLESEQVVITENRPPERRIICSAVWARRSADVCLYFGLSNRNMDWVKLGGRIFVMLERKVKLEAVASKEEERRDKAKPTFNLSVLANGAIIRLWRPRLSSVAENWEEDSLDITPHVKMGWNAIRIASNGALRGDVEIAVVSV